MMLDGFDQYIQHNNTDIHNNLQLFQNIIVTLHKTTYDTTVSIVLFLFCLYVIVVDSCIKYYSLMYNVNCLMFSYIR